MKKLFGKINIMQVLCVTCVVVIGIMATVGSVVDDDDDEKDYTPPVLSVSPVDIASLTFIIPFGADLTPEQKSSAFEYYVNGPDVEVRASCGKVVDRIFLNDNFPDYEVWVKTSTDNVYYVEYDHVLDLNIVVGEQVAPGRVLGIVGVGNRTELQIVRYVDGETAFCPFDFATDEFLQEHLSFTDEWCLEDTVIP